AVKIICGKPNLVIYNYMYGTPGFVSVKVSHLNKFIYKALPGNGSITVHNNRKYSAMITLELTILFGTDYTSNNGSCRCKVGWIRCYIDIDLLSAAGFAATGPSKVVFYVTIKNVLLIIFPVKFSKNVFCTFSENICKGI